jgi:hypothetical protein
MDPAGAALLQPQRSRQEAVWEFSAIFNIENLTSRALLGMVRRFRVNREPVAVRFARRRPVWGRLAGILSASAIHWSGSSPQGLMQQASMGRLRCGASSSQSYLRHPPPGRSQYLGWGPRMGYVGRNSETEPTPTSSGSGRQGLILEAGFMSNPGEARDARPPSTVVRLI